jgi:hypothetical protein
MNPSEIRDRIREGIAPALESHGFAGRSSTFSRRVGDLVHLIQLQSSSSNSSDSTRFTINVAVWAAVLSDEKTPSVANAHWSKRLGDCSPEPQDIWWNAQDDATADEAAKDISRRIEDFAIPELDKLRSTSDLLALWRSGESPGLTGVQADRLKRRLQSLDRDV